LSKLKNVEREGLGNSKVFEGKVGMIELVAKKLAIVDAFLWVHD
jgi:predicted RNA-binding protein